MDKCPNCGAKVSSSDKRCSKCGRELKKSSSKWIIGIVIAVALIAIAGIFASGNFLNNSSTDAAVVDNADSSDNSLNTNTQDSTDSQDNTNSEENTDSEDNSESGGTEYWASSKSDKFHTPDCEWAQKIKGSNKVVYHSRDDAIADGRVPCSVCNP